MPEKNGPWLRSDDRSQHFMMNVLLSLTALLAFSVFCYGWRPVLLVGCSVLSALVCELVCNAVQHNRPTVFDSTAMVTGMIVGLLMSPITAYWVPILASAFAIIVVKIPFGGAGRNVFNPAAAGVALVTQCFANRVFTYPDITVNASLPLGDIAAGDVITHLSPAADLFAGAGSHFTVGDVIWGEMSGPIGATAIFILIGAALFLFLRRTASPLITLPYLATCALIALCFPRNMDGGVWHGMAMELCSGYLLFAGIFLLNDPVTSPKFAPARVVYGVLAGCLVMLLRHTGRFEEGACFAVLMVNAITPLLDRGCWHLKNWMRERGVFGKRGNSV